MTRGDEIRRLKTSAIPSLQVEENENSENLCNPKIIRRFRQTAQCLKDVTNMNLKDKHSDITHTMKTIDNKNTYCSMPSTNHPLLTSRPTASSSALLQENMIVSGAQEDSDINYNSRSVQVQVKNDLFSTFQGFFEIMVDHLYIFVYAFFSWMQLLLMYWTAKTKKM